MTTALSEREIRARNYAIKRACRFRCAVCGTERGILVVRYEDKLTTACESHAAEADAVEPFQWDEAEREAEKKRAETAAKKPSGGRRRA